MKLLFTSLFMLILSTGICNAQRTFSYKVDQQSYSIEEQKLNDLFGQAFNKMIEYGDSKPKYFDMWVKAFTQWKQFTVKGYWSFETIGNRVSSSTYTGELDGMFLGYDEKHRVAKGNPNDEKNWPRRMQLLNYYLFREIIQYTTGKTIIN